MSLREFIASIWRHPRKRLAPPLEEWLAIAHRLKELQDPVAAPPNDAPLEGNSGQHLASSDSNSQLPTAKLR